MGAWIVSGSIWLALLCYPAGPLGLAVAADPSRRAMRLLWTSGCAAFLVHVVSSFEVFYDWSHATAYEETARQVAELTGRPNGAGIWVNYLFTLVWVADVAWWWRRETSYLARPRFVVALLHAFFLFIIFNATVVFEEGATRWFGLVVTVVGAIATWRAVTRRRGAP